MSHPNSHSDQIVSFKNTVKGAPKVRGVLFSQDDAHVQTDPFFMLYIIY